MYLYGLLTAHLTMGSDSRRAWYRAPAGEAAEPARSWLGRPLLASSARPWAGALLAGCAVLVIVLGVLFAHHTRADGLDRVIDAPVVNWLVSRQRVAVWMAFPGSPIPAIALSVVVAVGCLLAGRLNGAVLAIAAVPATTGLNDGLLKHLVDRTYLDVLSYPSGHTAAVFALAATIAILLLAPPQRARTASLRVLATAAVCALGAMVAVGVMGLQWHYFTDTVAGAATGTGTVCVLAFLLDLPVARRPDREPITR
jgi:membrane-associated phospholipid phosphatase